MQYLNIFNGAFLYIRKAKNESTFTHIFSFITIQKNQHQCLKLFIQKQMKLPL